MRMGRGNIQKEEEKKNKSSPSATLLPRTLAFSVVYVQSFLQELAPLIRLYVFKLHRDENPQCEQ